MQIAKIKKNSVRRRISFVCSELCTMIFPGFRICWTGREVPSVLPVSRAAHIRWHSEIFLAQRLVIYILHQHQVLRGIDVARRTRVLCRLTIASRRCGRIAVRGGFASPVVRNGARIMLVLLQCNFMLSRNFWACCLKMLFQRMQLMKLLPVLLVKLQQMQSYVWSRRQHLLVLRHLALCVCWAQSILMRLIGTFHRSLEVAATVSVAYQKV